MNSVFQLISSLCGAVAGVCTLIVAGRVLRQGRVTHDLMNSQHDDMVNRETQLTKSLTDADIPVPPHDQVGP